MQKQGIKMGFNKFILVAFLLIIMSASAMAVTSVNQTFNITKAEPLNTNGLNSAIYGMSIIVGTTPITLTRIVLKSVNTANRVCIYTTVNNVAPLNCTDVTNDVSVTNFNLNASTEYIIGADKQSATWTTQYNISTGLNNTFPKQPIETDKYLNYSRNKNAPYSTTPAFINIDGWSTVYQLTVEVTATQTNTILLNTNLVNTSTAVPYSNFTYNATFTGTASDYLYDCYLNISNVINQTSIATNLSYRNNFSVNWGNVVEVGKNVSISCNNTPINYTTSKYLYYIDTIVPTITFNVGNNSIVTRDLDILNFSVTYNDTNLFATNLTIFKLNADGSKNVSMNSTFATSLTGTGYVLNFSNNRSINIANYPNYTNGRYMIEAQAWDSHTALAIPDYKQDYVADGMVFNDNVKITSPDLVMIKTTKKTDRYNFDMQFNKANPTLYLDCPDITYLPQSKYKGHFVCFESKKWVDFEDYNGNIDKITATKVNNSRYEIKINQKSLLETIFNFNSIGDLNNVTQAVYFNVTDGFKFYATDLITGLPLSGFTVLVNTSPQQTRTAVGTNVTFNITNGTYYTNISLLNYVTNFTNIVFTQNSSKTWVITQANSLYLLFFDEQTNQYILQNVTVQIINFANTSYDTSTTTGVLFQQGFATGDYQVVYKSNNYAQRSYYTTIVGSDTQTIRLYLLNSTPTTHLYKNVQVTDESGVPIGSGTYNQQGVEVTNATISLLRFYVDCNCYRTVEMARTGEQGQTFIFAQLYDAIYKISVSVLGSTVKITPETRFDTRDVALTINLIESGIADYVAGTGLWSDLSYNENTGFATFTWVGDGDITGGTMIVQRVTAYNEYDLFNQTVNASSSAISYNLTALVNTTGTVIVKGYSHTATNTYLVASDTIDWTNGAGIFGLTGVFLTAIIVMIMALVGYYNPVTAIILSIVGLIGARFIGLIWIDIGWLLGLVVVAFIYAFKMRT